MSNASTQIHVLVGCSDARDVGPIHLQVVEEMHAAKVLGLRECLVVGNDQEQTDRMLRKVAADPIASLVVRHFELTLRPTLP